MSIVCNLGTDVNDKIKMAGLSTLAVVLVCSIVLIVLKYHQHSKNLYMAGEVNGQDYYSLLLKYDYAKGSKQGDDLKASLKKALGDGIITNSEYKQITKENPSYTTVLDKKNEYKKLYGSAKPQLIEIIKAS